VTSAVGRRLTYTARLALDWYESPLTIQFLVLTSGKTSCKCFWTFSRNELYILCLLWIPCRFCLVYLEAYATSFSVLYVWKDFQLPATLSFLDIKNPWIFFVSSISVISQKTGLRVNNQPRNYWSASGKE
jgi:hypothetical protein